jgi:hypothetical protein
MQNFDIKNGKKKQKKHRYIHSRHRGRKPRVESGRVTTVQVDGILGTTTDTGREYSGWRRGALAWFHGCLNLACISC